MKTDVSEMQGRHALDLRGTSIVLAVMCLSGLLLYPDALVKWLYQLPVHPLSEFLILQAQNWADFCRDSLHLNVFFDSCREAFRALQGGFY